MTLLLLPIRTINLLSRAYLLNDFFLHCRTQTKFGLCLDLATSHILGKDFFVVTIFRWFFLSDPFWLTAILVLLGFDLISTFILFFQDLQALLGLVWYSYSSMQVSQTYLSGQPFSFCILSQFLQYWVYLFHLHKAHYGILINLYSMSFLFGYSLLFEWVSYSNLSKFTILMTH